MLRILQRTLVTSAKAAIEMNGITVEQFGGPEVLKYVNNLPKPSAPTGTQVLVSVKAAGVNPVDTYIRSGTHAVKPELPYTPGGDGAGIVQAVGPQATKFKVGDRVYWCKAGLAGCYSEQILAEEASTHALHDSLTFQQGAALGIPYFTAYRALVTKANLRPGETVFVHGASGAVGMACCQIAKAIGAKVAGTIGSNDGLQSVLDNGASLVFNHHVDDWKEIKAAVGKIDVIVEMVANVNLQKDLEMSNENTRIIIVGSRGPIEIAPVFFMTTELILTGVMLPKATSAEWREMVAFINAGQELGWVKPVIGEEYPLAKAAEAHKQIIEHAGGTKGKIILTLQ